MEVGELRKRLAKLIEKDGFYFILFLCVCIVAVTAVIISKGKLNKEEDIAENKEDELIILDNELNSEETLEIAKLEEEKESTGNEEEEGGEEQEEVLEEETTAQQVKKETTPQDATAQETMAISNPESSSKMIAPVNGTIGTKYTEDNLIYSETLEEWTAHNGIDIMAAEGTKVVAALGGTVQEVYDDPLWGKVVIIDHGNNLLTKYANLSEEVLVQEGVSVNQGDAIGQVGTTAKIEMKMEPHVHFEVIEAGVSVNPSKYLPAF